MPKIVWYIQKSFQILAVYKRFQYGFLCAVFMHIRKKQKAKQKQQKTTTDSFISAARIGNAKMLVFTPVFQNSTGVLG